MTRYFRQHVPADVISPEAFTKYTAVSEKPQVNGVSTDYPKAEIQVSHTPEQYSAIWANKTGIPAVDHVNSNLGGFSNAYLVHLVTNRHHGAADNLLSARSRYEDEYYYHNRDEDHWTVKGAKERLDQALEAFNATPEASPETLFATSPEQHVIDKAYADPSMKHTIPMLGAMAHMDINKDGGSHKLIASHSLSSYSSPLTQNAVKRGLPIQTHEHNPEALVRNQEVFRNMAASPNEMDTRYKQSKALSETQVGEIRSHLKGMLRGEPIRNVTVNAPKFRQPTLPGMNGF